MPRRNSKGRFVKGGGSSSTKRRRSSGGTKIVRVGSSKPVIIRAPAAAPARRHGRRRRGGGFSSAGGRIPLKTKGEIAGWASLIGYVKETKAATFNQIPQVGKLPREALLGAGLHFFGGKNKHVDRAAVSALTIAGYEIGKAGFSLSGWEDD